MLNENEPFKSHQATSSVLAIAIFDLSVTVYDIFTVKISGDVDFDL